jgi:hypothetical protein
MTQAAHFVITGIERPTEAVLQQARPVQVTAPNSAPCRVSLQDAEPGETVLLFNYAHHERASPYRSIGPIFVRAEATKAARYLDHVPEAIVRRLMSARAYDEAGDMIDAEVVEGTQLEPLLTRLFGNPDVAFIHLHHARRGCFAALVTRA